MLTKGEESLMELFWSAEKSLTSMQVAEMTDEFNDSYIHKLLKSLLAKKIIKVDGLVSSGKQYARAFTPILSKEEYAARVMYSLGIRDQKALAKVAVAMVNKSEDNDIKALVQELECIVDKLKEQ
nr:BlaI/MecI/CopY family transcriptional regulator [Butyricicoccus faecihominis]